MRGQDHYFCSAHLMTGGYTNRRSIRRAVLGRDGCAALTAPALKDRLMASEAAMQAYAKEETNRLAQLRASRLGRDRKELAAIGKKIASMIAAIKDGGYVRGMSDRLRELEARQDELTALLSAVPADLPDIHPSRGHLPAQGGVPCRRAEAARRPTAWRRRTPSGG